MDRRRAAAGGRSRGVPASGILMVHAVFQERSDGQGDGGRHRGERRDRRGSSRWRGSRWCWWGARPPTQRRSRRRSGRPPTWPTSRSQRRFGGWRMSSRRPIRGSTYWSTTPAGSWARGGKVDGLERTRQVNQLSPFRLTGLLIPTPIPRSARVIQTASIAVRRFGRGVVATNFASETTSWFWWVYRTPMDRSFRDTPDEGGRRLARLVRLAVRMPGRRASPAATTWRTTRRARSERWTARR